MRLAREGHLQSKVLDILAAVAIRGKCLFVWTFLCEHLYVFAYSWGVGVSVRNWL
jgi:hypothetical protein